MTIRLLYFAQLVDKLGLSSETLELPPEVNDVRALLAFLRARGGQWEKNLADDAVRVTVNRQIASLDAPLAGSVEIGIFSTRHG
jgi:molybdopterin synthase sulfur carrier subunit